MGVSLETIEDDVHHSVEQEGEAEDVVEGEDIHGFVSLMRRV